MPRPVHPVHGAWHGIQIRNTHGHKHRVQSTDVAVVWRPSSPCLRRAGGGSTKLPSRRRLGRPRRQLVAVVRRSSSPRLRWAGGGSTFELPSRRRLRRPRQSGPSGGCRLCVSVGRGGTSDTGGLIPSIILMWANTMLLHCNRVVMIKPHSPQ